VELGWAGLAAWILWILAALWLMVSNLLKALKACDPLSWIAVGTLCAFVGLLLNGMVEYNFGDSEILMLFLFLIGVAWAQQLVRDEAV
jgi:O-antigen ligase